MTIDDQIKIVASLIEAAEELNGEFQYGWDEVIDNGESLLEYLKEKDNE